MPAVPGMMQEALVPGLQMAVIADGRIELRSFGVRDVRTGAPVAEDTVFEAASLGKSVFAYGVLRLASEGRIDLDAPIGRYLEGLTGVLASVTPRQLLSHSAGLPNSPPRSGALTPERPPEPRFSYSGEGISLLQRAVERITGQNLQDYMRRAVFEPLGMANSSYVWRDDFADKKAFGHGFTGNWAGRSRIAQAQAPSSLETTAADYARFLVATTRGAGLRPDIARQFLRPQVALEEGCVVCIGRPRGVVAEGLHWGLGFGLAERGGRTFAWHWGDNQTMQSYAAITTDGRRGLVILTNSANGHSIARQIASVVLGVEAPGYAWVDSYESYTDPPRRLLSRIVRHGASALRPEDLELPRAKVLQVAERLTTGDRPAEAASLLRRLIATGKATTAEHALLADALRRQDLFAEAREAADAALRLDPRNEGARLALDRIGQAERVVPAGSLARFAGLYSSPFGPLEIRSDGRKLTAHLIDQPPSEMLPLSDSAFLMERMGVPIEFVEGEAGNVTHALVRAGGDIRLPRVNPKR